MIRLPAPSAAPATPGRVTLIPHEDESKAVWVETIPMNRAIRRRAKRAALRRLDGADLKNLEPIEIEDFGEAYTHELLRLLIVGWGGVLEGDGDDAPVAELTPAYEVRMRTSTKPDRPTGTIDAFLGIDQVFEAADRLIVMPIVERDREKNGSSASQNGTGEAGTPGNNTASSLAEAKTTRAAAKSAPTG